MNGSNTLKQNICGDSWHARTKLTSKRCWGSPCICCPCTQRVVRRWRRSQRWQMRSDKSGDQGRLKVGQWLKYIEIDDVIYLSIHLVIHHGVMIRSWSTIADYSHGCGHDWLKLFKLLAPQSKQYWTKTDQICNVFDQLMYCTNSHHDLIHLPCILKTLWSLVDLQASKSCSHHPIYWRIIALISPSWSSFSSF